MKKGYLQISFSWLFALVAGGFILFLAIYFAMNLMDTGSTTSDAKTAENIGVLLNPLEAGAIQSAKTSLTFPVETRIYTRCSDVGVFGKQKISVSQKNFNEWSETDLEVSFYNRYIFSENPEGNKFYVFLKKLEMPFKISDLIYLVSSKDKYCFKNAPEEIDEEISGLGIENFYTENCPENSKEICFNQDDCEISVNINNEYVKKNDKEMYFKVLNKDSFGDENYALMYAAIFSNPEEYECQLNRLMKRLEQLSILYDEKAKFVSSKGCSTNLNLAGLANLADNYGDSGDLSSVFNKAKEINDKNKYAECQLW